VDAGSTIVFKYAYDGNDRLTNRWTPAKNTTAYAYDNLGNLTSIAYPISPSVALAYDAMSRLTCDSDSSGPRFKLP
jgi:YD repeat-containing protein